MLIAIDDPKYVFIAACTIPAYNESVQCIKMMTLGGKVPRNRLKLTLMMLSGVAIASVVSTLLFTQTYWIDATGGSALLVPEVSRNAHAIVSNVSFETRVNERPSDFEKPRDPVGDNSQKASEGTSDQRRDETC